jgi:hypothetical protein
MTDTLEEMPAAEADASVRRAPRKRRVVIGAAALAVVITGATAAAMRTGGNGATSVHQPSASAPGADDPGPAPTTTAAPAPAPAAAPTAQPQQSGCPTAATPPEPRFGATLAVDTTGVAVVGGRGADFNDRAETWSFGCGRWGRRLAGSMPPAQIGAVSAFDGVRGQSVLLAADASTWTWDGTAWSAKRPAVSPPRFWQPSAAYDDARSRVLVYGGAMSGGEVQTWTWDGTTWAKASGGAGPAARGSAALAFDSARGKAVLFGGMASETQGVDETWTWNGSAWAKQSPAHTPAPGPATAAYDPVHKHVVLLDATGATYTWDGGDWVKQTPTASPARRLYQAMAWVPALNRVVVFGGKVVRPPTADGKADEEVVNDLWAWDGSNWTRLS